MSQRRDSIFELCDRLEAEGRMIGRVILSQAEAADIANMLRRYVATYGPLPRVDANKSL